WFSFGFQFLFFESFFSSQSFLFYFSLPCYFHFIVRWNLAIGFYLFGFLEHDRFWGRFSGLYGGRGWFSLKWILVWKLLFELFQSFFSFFLLFLVALVNLVDYTADNDKND